MKVSSFNSRCIYRSIYMKNFIYRSIYFNIAQYMIPYFDHICFHISGVIRPLHISVNISPLRLNHWKITYIDQYMPTSGIYRSIYVIFQWFKLGAYIGPIYVRSYNDRYIKTYILPKCGTQSKVIRLSTAVYFLRCPIEKKLKIDF